MRPNSMKIKQINANWFGVSDFKGQVKLWLQHKYNKKKLTDRSALDAIQVKVMTTVRDIWTAAAGERVQFAIQRRVF